MEAERLEWQTNYNVYIFVDFYCLWK